MINTLTNGGAFSWKYVFLRKKFCLLLAMILLLSNEKRLKPLFFFQTNLVLHCIYELSIFITSFFVIGFSFTLAAGARTDAMNHLGQPNRTTQFRGISDVMWVNSETVYLRIGLPRHTAFHLHV